MGRSCTVCNHSELEEINRRLARCDSIAGIARDFALSEDAIGRHKDSHLPKNLIASPSVDEMTQADRLLCQIEQYKTEIAEMKDEARSEGNIELALKAVDRALRCIELQSKVRGLIQDRPRINLTQVNVYDSPEWSRVGSMLSEVLDPYPQLKPVVAARLLALARGEA
jgi:hypothetical protein